MEMKEAGTRVPASRNANFWQLLAFSALPTRAVVGGHDGQQREHGAAADECIGVTSRHDANKHQGHSGEYRRELEPNEGCLFHVYFLVQFNGRKIRPTL
jgi:hypothetical protein